MTKPTKSSKLSLQAESIRNLNAGELGQIGGGSLRTLPGTSITLSGNLSNTVVIGTYTTSSKG